MWGIYLVIVVMCDLIDCFFGCWIDFIFLLIYICILLINNYGLEYKLKLCIKLFSIYIYFLMKVF